MKTLGVTGGIGSGKSYVCDLFARKGIPIYDSDSRTKELYKTDMNLLSSLVESFGKEILCKESKNGKLELDKNKFAELIFRDNNQMEKVKQIVYPIVMKDFRDWRDSQKDTIPFVIMESALILENEIVKKEIDKVLTVFAPLEIRIERIIKRDGGTLEQINRRLSAQWGDIQRMSFSDFVVLSGDENNVIGQVDNVYNRMKY